MTYDEDRSQINGPRVMATLARSRTAHATGGPGNLTRPWAERFVIWGILWYYS